MAANNTRNLGRMLKQRRLMESLTLRKLAMVSDISSSHLSRIERGERFPSASILKNSQAARFGGKGATLFGWLPARPVKSHRREKGRI